MINAAAAVRDYSVDPRLEYRTISAVNGPLVILENVKSPQYGIPLVFQYFYLQHDIFITTSKYSRDCQRNIR